MGHELSASKADSKSPSSIYISASFAHVMYSEGAYVTASLDSFAARSSLFCGIDMVMEGQDCMSRYILLCF
jgi:hypothetical protein